MSKVTERNLLKKESFCINCGEFLDFYPWAPNRKYCSKECHLNSRSVDFTCQFCGKEMRVSKKLAVNKKYCSRECYGNTISITGVGFKQKICINCNIKFKTKSGHAKYCVKCRTHECLECGKIFTANFGSKYCSQKCRSKPIASKPCPICGKEFISRNKYCSRECFGNSRKVLWATTNYRYKMMSSWNTTPTRIESKITNVIHSNKLPFKYVGDGKFFIVTKKRTCIPDFVHISKKQVIECNGNYWHNYEKDNAKTKAYQSMGWRVLNLTGSEINDLDNRSLAKIISAFENGKDRPLRKKNYK